MVNRTATLRRLLSLARPEWKLLGAGVLFLGLGSAMALLYPQGMRIIIDYVLNHTSDQHPWFVDSQKSNSPYRDWYIWSKTDPGYEGPWGVEVVAVPE